MIPFKWQQYRLSVGTPASDVKTNGDEIPSGTFSPARFLVSAACIKGIFLSLHSSFYLTLKDKPFGGGVFLAKDERKKLIQDNSVTWALRNPEINSFQWAFLLPEFLWESIGGWAGKGRFTTKQDYLTFGEKLWTKKNKKLLQLNKKLKCVCCINRLTKANLSKM